MISDDLNELRSTIDLFCTFVTIAAIVGFDKLKTACIIFSRAFWDFRSVVKLQEDVD